MPFRDKYSQSISQRIFQNPNKIIILLIFLCIITITNSAEHRANLMHVTLNIPKEGAVISFNCTAAGEVKPKFWILPDGKRIYVDEQKRNMRGLSKNEVENHDNNQNLTSKREYQNNDSEALNDFTEGFDDSVNVSANQLTIHGVRRGMDGQYICVVEDDRRQIFFIPYVIAQIDYSRSVVISLCVSLGFAVVCCLVLILDRYFLVPGSWQRLFSRRIHDPSYTGRDQPMRTPSRKSNHSIHHSIYGIDQIDDFPKQQQRENTYC